MLINTRKHQDVRAVGIKSVKLDGYEDVYNMEVKGTHNFAVNGGLIIHNCMDEIRYFCNTIMTKRVKDATEEYKSLFGR